MKKNFFGVICMINDGTADDVVGKFESEIISQNKIIELEKELDGANSRAESEALRADNAEAENRRLKNEIELLKSQLNSN